MAEVHRPRLYTVPLGASLVDELAAYLLGQVSGQREKLADTLLLLPNNRAIKALTHAFVRQADNGLLLPRMAAVGDLGIDDVLGPLFDPLGEDAAEPVPPAIGAIEKELLLTKLVAAQRPQLSPVEALKLARSIAAAIDQLDIEQISLKQIQDTDRRDDLSIHWQSAYRDFITIAEGYQNALSVAGLLNPSARRNMLLDRFSSRLPAMALAGDIIAVGITTAAPALARLLKAIAMKAGGLVVWPHIDLAMREDDWMALGPNQQELGDIADREEGHPQYQFKLLFEKMGIAREEVDIFPGTKASPYAFDTIFASADTTPKWLTMKKAEQRLPNLRTMTATDSTEEALAISILIRQAIETRGKTINLITPDRELAQRVTMQLRRWDIVVDDSAGQPLAAMPSTALLLGLAECVANRFSPVSLLAVLKHPFAEAGEGRVEWLRLVRLLDGKLRGPRRGIGLDAIGADLKDDPLKTWWEQTADILKPLDFTKAPDFAALVDLLCECATKLTNGGIWLGQVGRQLAQLLEDYRSADLAIFDKIDRLALPALIAQLLNQETVRSVYGSHPRIAIYGLLEARMQQADLVICAGLNEGTWPQPPSPDPWLAPRIRAELALPGSDRNIGLAAHDLLSAMCAKEVVLTRAQRDRSGPSVASRFWLRLQAFCGDQLAEESDALLLARAIDAAKRTASYVQPAPNPTATQRRVAISITQVDELKGDPYSFYARKILRLRNLDPVDADATPAWRGNEIHDVLEDWAKQDDCVPDALVARAESRLADPAFPPILRALWQPRITAALRWVANETERLKSEDGRIVADAEADGEIILSGITLKGRADRIDRLSDGSLAIVDYKSGKAPAAKAINAGFKLQLGLVGALAERGALKKVSGKATAFEYWSLAKAGKAFGEVKRPVGGKSKAEVQPEDFVGYAISQATTTINAWLVGNKPFTAKLHPEYVDYADYDQLMRRAEWYGREPVGSSDAD
jgi:ATP-dependent helicase/nuclease subunit B